MAYIPPTDNISTGVGFFQWLNLSLEGWFFPGMVIAVWFIMVVTMLYRTDKIGQSFVAASFVSLIVTVLLRTANLVSNTFMVIFIILTALGALWMHTENAKFV